MLQIRIGLQKGLDVSWYAKPEYNWKQMKGFRNCLEKKIDKKDKIKLMLLTRALMENIDFTPYVLNENFNYGKLVEIELGLENELDVSLYAKPEFNEDQMREIRLGLESGVDVSYYSNPNIYYIQMKYIRFCLTDGFHSNILNFSCEALKIIYEGLQKKLDVSWYANPEFNCYQMEEIKSGLEKRLDVSWYARPELLPNKCYKLNWLLKKNFQ